MSNFEKLLHFCAIYTTCLMGNLLIVLVAGGPVASFLLSLCMLGTIALLGIKGWRWLHAR